MTTLTRLAMLAALFVAAFPLSASADSTSMALGTTVGNAWNCTNSFYGYWGHSTLSLNRVSVYASDGSQSTVFKVLGVSYSVSYGYRPNICVKFTPTTPGTYSAWVDARYGYFNEYIASVYVTATYAPPTGWVKPKYVILGILYSPPGAQSRVTYGNNTVVGNSTSLVDSFSSQVTKSVSVSSGFKIFGIGKSQTATYTNSYTQSAETASSIAVTKTTSNSISLAGYSDPTYGVNHDYDYIMVWLNPVLTFAAGTDHIEWTGYGFDEDDTAADMNVIGIPTGCLNGNFLGGHAMAPTCDAIISGPLQRRWAQNNVDGSGPGLTGTVPCVPGSDTDLCNILAANPFGDPNFQITPPPAGSYTTSDGRFTACNNSLCNQTIPYEPYLTFSYSQGYSTTATQSQTVRRVHSTSYAMDAAFEASLFKQKFTASLKYSNVLTWTHQFSRATTNTSGQASSFSIVGPNPGYAGPLQFVVYQDNLYGTFVFSPQ